MIAYSTTEGTMLWQTQINGQLFSLRIHSDVVLVPVEDSETLVVDVTSGHQIHTLPSAGKYVHGICVFDGLTSSVGLFS